MPDEATETPAVEEDTSQTTDTPEAPETPETPEATDTASEDSVDFEKRYNDLRPEFDRTNQVLAALQGRHGPEAQQEAAQMFGFEFADEDEDKTDSEYLSPEEELRKEIEGIKAERAEERQQAEAEALDRAEEKWLKENVDTLLDKKQATLTDNERQLLISHATSNRFEDGQPDIEGAYDLLAGAEEAARSRYLESKKAPKVPVGSAGEKAIDLNDDEQRQAAMVADIEAFMESEGS